MSGVPSLDLAAFTAGGRTERAAFSAALMAGLQDTGFILLSGHGLGAALLDDAYRLSADLFARPLAWKLRCRGNQRGYAPFGLEHAKDHAAPDLKEFWQIGRDHDARADPADSFEPNRWPDAWPDFRTTFVALFEALDLAGRRLLAALETPLDLPHGHFDAMCAGGNSLLRLLHYPPVPDDADPRALRSAPHEDINLLTLLVAARGPGLEIRTRDGRWRALDSGPGELVVNAADMLQRMTNGAIPSTTHRVVNPGGPNESRYSMPFFLHPRSGASLAAIPSCAGAGERWPPITAGAYLAERLREIGLA